VPRKIFQLKREEEAHTEEVLNLHTSPNTIKVIRSRRMGWIGHVVYMGKMKNAYKILVGKLEGKT
jgi:hypothetical protein